jgi:hypothetical protein
MKNQFLILKGMLSVSLIVLSTAVLVNYQPARTAGTGNTHVADGVPLPPPTTPPPKQSSVQVADGVPLPPPTTPPPKSASI